MTKEQLVTMGLTEEQATKQLTMAIAAKVDNGCHDVLMDTIMKHDGLATVIGYTGIVDDVDKIYFNQHASLAFTHQATSILIHAPHGGGP